MYAVSAFSHLLSEIQKYFVFASLLYIVLYSFSLHGRKQVPRPGVRVPIEDKGQAIGLGVAARYRSLAVAETFAQRVPPEKGAVELVDKRISACRVDGIG